MTVKHIEEYHCDRCKRKFEHRESDFGQTRTMDIGWFAYTNGSGSRNSSSLNVRWENLDYNLCSTCTEEFESWWNNPEKD